MRSENEAMPHFFGKDRFIRAPTESMSHSLSALFYDTLLSLESLKVSIHPQHLRSHLLRFYISHAYSVLCLLSFLDVTDLANKDAYFWPTLNWLRPDFIIVQLSQSETVLYILWSVVLEHWILFLWISWRRMKTVKNYLAIGLPLLQIQGISALDVSIASLLLSRAVLLIDSTADTHLYGTEAEPTQWKQGISFAIFLLYVLLQCVREFKSTQMKHSKERIDIVARASSIVECVQIVSVHCITLSYFFLSTPHPYVHLGLVCGWCVGLIVVYYVRIPYYNLQINAVIVALQSFLGVSAFAVLWSALINSALFAIVATVLAGPLVGYLMYCHYTSFSVYSLNYYSKQLPNQQETCKIELGFREAISTAQTASRADQEALMSHILEKFKTMVTVKPKMVLLWSVDFALNVLENESLARLKLAQANFATSEFEADYLEAKFVRELRKSEGNEAVKYLRYFERMERVKNIDAELCHCLIEFYTELVSKRPYRSTVRRCCRIIEIDINYLGREYRSLIKDFPKTRDVFKLYASFLEDILRVFDKANTVRIQGKILCDIDQKTLNQVDINSTFSLFQKDCGIIFVDASPGNAEKIIYANDLAHVNLGYKLGMLIENPMSCLIPHPFRSGHMKKVSEFLQSSVTLRHNHPSLMYLSNASGHLVECVINVSFAAINNTPLILIAFRPTESLKEVAILTETGEVASCTQGFPSRLGLSQTTPIVGNQLEQVNESLWRARADYNTVTQIELDSIDPVYALFIEQAIGECVAHILYLFDTENEARLWQDLSKEAADHLNSLWDKSDPNSEEIPSRKRTRTNSNLVVSGRRRHRSSFVQFLPPMHEVDTESSPKKPVSQAFSHFGGRDQVDANASASNSNSNFLKSPQGKRLISSLQSKFRKLMQILLLTVTAIQVTVMLVGNALIVNYVNTNMQYAISTNEVSTYTLRDLYVTQLAQNARYIALNNSGIPTPSPSSEYKRAILQVAANLTDIQSQLFSSPYNYDVLVWQLLDDEVVMQTVNLVDAVSNIVAYVRINTGFEDSVYPSLFYLFRNGYGETHQALEDSVAAYIAQERISIQAIAAQTYAYFLPFVVILSLACGVTIAYLCRIQAQVNVLSSLLMSYKVSTYIEQKQVILDRLATLHGEEIPVQSEGLIGSHKPMRLYNACGLGSALALGIVVLSLLCYALEYFFLVQHMSDALTSWPGAISMSSDRICNAVQLWSWLFEVGFSAIPVISINSMPGYSDIASPMQELMSVFQENEMYQSALLAYDLNGHTTMSSARFNFSYDHIVSDCIYLQYGFEIGMWVYNEDAKYAADDIADGQNDGTVINLYTCSAAIVNQANTLISLYNNDIEAEVQKWVQFLILTVCLQSIVVLGVFGVGMYWALRKSKKQVQAIWKALSLFQGWPQLPKAKI